MRIYCNLKLKGISTSKDFDSTFSGFNRLLHLDDIHFVVPNPKNEEEEISIHTDFDMIDGSFEGDKYITRFKVLADTWNDLNLQESNIQKEDITPELLLKGYIENFVMFFVKDNKERFTDISIDAIAIRNAQGEIKHLKVNKDAINEA